MAKNNVFAEYATLADERNNRLRGSSLWTRFVGMLNNWFNVEHDWFDYASMDSKARAIENQYTKADLTGAEKAANAFTANEAQKQRDWETDMSNTAYQRQVKDMQAAGINPAMAMNGAGASTPSGASASSVSPGAGLLSFGDIMQALLLPMQKKLMQSQAKLASDQGQAALITAKANERNAGTNERNAGTNERNAATNEFDAETRRMMQQLEERKTGIYEGLTDEQKKEIAERAALLNLQRQQLPEQLEIAKKNANSQERQALASLRQADAAVQNAATNDRLADYDTSLKYAEEMLTWYKADGQNVVNKFLPERERAEIDRIVKDGIRLDKQGRLIDKTGRAVDAQMVATYVNAACNVSNAANRWVNPLAGMSSPASSPFTIDSTIGAGSAIQVYGGM